MHGKADQKDAPNNKVQHDSDRHNLDQEELQQLRVKILRRFVLQKGSSAVPLAIP